jgi:DNA-binding CsgD family transcriptional regulator
VVATEKGIYAFNEKRDQFEPSAYFSKWLGTQSLRYLKEDTEGNIWFIHEKSMGVLDFSSKEPKVIYLAELDNKMLSGFEMLYPINPQNILLAGEDGFYHINYKKYSAQKKQPAVTLREVRISNQGDSILFAGYSPTLQDDNERSLSLNPTIDHPWKNILFKFSSPVFGGHNKIEFSYRLKGYESNWSEWSEKNEKEYTNLPAGNYRFEIISRISRGQASEPIGYSFTILAPWYLSRLAYLLYSVLTLTAIYYLIKRQRKKLSSQRKFHEEEQKRLQALHEYEISKAERELIALRNEKLQTDIDFKNSELATTAMHLVQKGELIAKVKSDLTHIMKELNNEKATGELKKMIKMLSDDDKMDKDWEHFTQHFDKVHSDFVLVLKEAHSNISPNETKLCTYLRMNLSTKEIAQLMNISVRGVEISRYRLRKKLGIPKEISLFDYLIRLGGKREL